MSVQLEKQSALLAENESYTNELKSHLESAKQEISSNQSAFETLNKQIEALKLGKAKEAEISNEYKIENNNESSDQLIELRSQIEAEKKKCEEYQNELSRLKQELESSQNEDLKRENESLNAKLSEALLNQSTNNSSDETHSKLLNEYNSLFMQLNQFITTNQETQTVSEGILNHLEKISNHNVKQFYDNLVELLKQHEISLKKENDRIRYVEDHMANAVKDFKEEISSLEVKLDENQKEYINYKLQVVLYIF